MDWALVTGHVLLALYLVAMWTGAWWISGHLPLSNGAECMLFMALCGVLGGVFVRSRTVKGALMAVAALALLVAFMGGSRPQIGALMPVLGSPLLSVHVMLVMSAYLLLLLTGILSAVALTTGKTRELARTNRLILVPAVFLLAAGIFTGAVWANQSWGRYWGWDPKETCALIMMLVYAVPIHFKSLKPFRRPKVLHWYLLLALLTMALTYFGANYLLPGLHSYA